MPAARRTLAPLLGVLILALLTQPAAAGVYGIRSNGTYVRLAADETDRYDVGGAVGLRTPAAYTSSAPCDLRVKFGLGIRWSDGSFGKRGAWSDVFTNYDNPTCA